MPPFSTAGARLLVERLKPDDSEPLTLPAGAAVVNSWIEHASGGTSDGSVIVLIKLAPDSELESVSPAGPSTDVAWEKRWTGPGEPAPVLG